MIHPSRLLRADSERSPFEATRSANPLLSEHDCGITALPCLAKRLHLLRFYKLTIFIALLAILVLWHSSCAAYLVGTAKVWRHNYNLSKSVAEWILFLSPVLSGVFGALVAFYGDTIHRTSCIGALAMMHAVAGWLLIVPEVYHPEFEHLDTLAVADQLCGQRMPITSGAHPVRYDEGKTLIAVSVLILYQLVNALSLMAIISLGLAYIDDGCKKMAATRNVCIVVAGWEIGKLIGLNTSLIPVAFNRHIFFSFAWLTLTALVFLFGFLISLFPKHPKRVVVGHGVDLLLRRTAPSHDGPKPTYLSTVGSLLKSRILLLNMAAASLMNAATINFSALRDALYRARLVRVADTSEPHFSVFSGLQVTFLCLVVGVLAVVVEKRRPTTRFYVTWVCVAYTLVLVLFASQAFLRCDEVAVDTSYNSHLKGCNGRCECSMDVFAPVCLEGRTYYSACFAGCSRREDDMYSNCACALTPGSGRAVEGVCSNSRCALWSLIAEANGVVSAGLRVSAFVMHLMLTMRAIKSPSQKPTAIGLFLASFLLLPFIPFKLVYDWTKGLLCRYNAQQECIQFSASFPLMVGLMAASLMVLAVVLSLCMLPLAKQVNIHKRCGSISRPRPETIAEEHNSESDFDSNPEGQVSASSQQMDQVTEETASRLQLKETPL